MGKSVKKALGVVAVIGLAIVTGGASLVAKFALQAVLAIGVSKLLGNRAGSKAAGAETSGARIQLPPATNNKLPVSYGTAFLGSSITDAKISTDQKTMWFVLAVTEVPTGETITFDEIYYDNKLVTFGTNGAVASLTNNAQGTPQVDTKVANKIFIYLFPNGSSSGTNTGGQTAIQILSDASIPAGQRWNGSIYTSGGQSPTMDNTAFMIVKLIYDDQAGVTGLGTLAAKVTCSLTKPGEAILDYMQNTRYGCAIPLAQIDTASLTALDTYSDGLIDYTDVNGNPATQARYRINGPLDTGIDCLTNLQNLVDACDSWLQYSEITGKWKVVINKAYDQTPNAQTLSQLYEVDSSNLIGGIDISPVDLNGTFNQLEVQYPDTNIKDQTNYAYVDLYTEYPALISANEPINKLVVQNQLINNYVQAKFIGIRRLLQSREDLVISCQLDYSGIQLEAGDVVKITLAEYGWTDKLFRVSNVIEEKFADGSLGARIQAFEYNSTIYDDDLDITDFIPADNTGLTDPNVIATPAAPTVELLLANTIATMQVTGVVPNTGLVRYLEFNVGTDSNSANHTYYTNVTNANGVPLTANTSYTIEAGDLSANTYYWSVTAKNNQVAVRGPSSNSVGWNGQNVTTSNTFTACNANSTASLFTTDAIANVPIGGLVTITSGTGTLQANTRVTSIVDSTQFFVNLVPTVALSNACISITAGGITGNNVQANSITYDNLNAGITASEALIGYSYVTGDIPSNTVTMPINLNTFSANIKVESVADNFQIAKYLTSNYSGGGGTFPYYTGNSSTVDGYFANSTSAFNPATAAYLILENGDLNWQVVDYQYVGSNAVPAGQQIGYDWSAHIVSNVDATLQIAPFITFNSSLTLGAIDTQVFDTIDLTANTPVEFSANRSYSGTGTIDGAGIYVRSLTSGANIVFFTGFLQTYRKR